MSTEIPSANPLKDYERLILPADQRTRITDIVGSDDEEMFLRVEEILTDYHSTQVLDDMPKAAEARDILMAISKYAREGKIHMLEKKLNQLHMWTNIEMQLLYNPAKDLAELARQAEDLAHHYANRKTPRRTDQVRNARDFALRELVEIFKEYASNDDDIEAEWLDKCEIFMVETLGYAGLPVPAASGPDVSREGEAKQGRLRRQIKSYLSKYPSK